MTKGVGSAPGTTGNYERYDVAIEAIVEGDLTRDDAPETVILFSCSPQPSNYAVQEVAVYSPNGETMAHLPEIEPMPGGLDLPPVYAGEAFTIAGGKLYTPLRYYAAPCTAEAESCDGTDSRASGPSIGGVVAWRWNGKEFLVSNR